MNACWNAWNAWNARKNVNLVKKTWKNCMLKNLYNFLIDDDDDFINQRHTKKSLITIQEKR